MSLPHVSDHAVIRYLERVRGINVDLIREHIALLCAPAANAGAANLLHGGFKYVFDHGDVVTITPIGAKPSRTHQARAMGERT
jgi:hypothetical protein